MKFIKTKTGGYIRADKITTFAVNRVANRYYVTAYTDIDNGSNFALAEFDDRAFAETYLADLVAQFDEGCRESSCCHKAADEPEVPIRYTTDYFKPATVGSYKYVDFKPTWGDSLC